jgi:hypothetical protein
MIRQIEELELSIWRARLEKCFGAQGKRRAISVCDIRRNKGIIA